MESPTFYVNPMVKLHLRTPTAHELGEY